MTESSSTRTLAQKLRSHLVEEIMLIILVGLVIALSIKEPVFLSMGNLMNVLRTMSITGVIAFGMTMVIISAEIDLSVGSMVAFSGCLCAFVIDAVIGDDGSGAVMAVILGVLAAIGAGVATGMFTGFMRTLFNVPTFITTLGLLTALRGGALLITDGFPITSLPRWFTWLGNGSVGAIEALNFPGIPVPALILLVVFIVGHVVMNFTTYGRAIYATGGNPEAARLSGVNISLVRISVLAITGGLAALGGLLMSAKIGSGTPTVAEGLELDVIAAVIIGGTSLFGGRGRMWGTLVGLLFIGVIVNGMILLGLRSEWQFVVRGGLILGAVLINQATAKVNE